MKKFPMIYFCHNPSHNPNENNINFHKLKLFSRVINRENEKNIYSFVGNLCSAEIKNLFIENTFKKEAVYSNPCETLGNKKTKDINNKNRMMDKIDLLCNQVQSLSCELGKLREDILIKEKRNDELERKLNKIFDVMEDLKKQTDSQHITSFIQIVETLKKEIYDVQKETSCIKESIRKEIEKLEKILQIKCKEDKEIFKDFCHAFENIWEMVGN